MNIEIQYTNDLQLFNSSPGHQWPNLFFLASTNLHLNQCVIDGNANIIVPGSVTRCSNNVETFYPERTIVIDYGNVLIWQKFSELDLNI